MNNNKSTTFLPSPRDSGHGKLAVANLAMADSRGGTNSPLLLFDNDEKYQQRMPISPYNPSVMVQTLSSNEDSADEKQNRNYDHQLLATSSQDSTPANLPSFPDNISFSNLHRMTDTLDESHFIPRASQKMSEQNRIISHIKNISNMNIKQRLTLPKNISNAMFKRSISTITSTTAIVGGYSEDAEEYDRRRHTITSDAGTIGIILTLLCVLCSPTANTGTCDYDLEAEEAAVANEKVIHIENPMKMNRNIHRRSMIQYPETNLDPIRSMDSDLPRLPSSPKRIHPSEVALPSQTVNVVSSTMTTPAHMNTTPLITVDTPESMKRQSSLASLELNKSTSHQNYRLSMDMGPEIDLNANVQSSSQMLHEMNPANRSSPMTRLRSETTESQKSVRFDKQRNTCLNTEFNHNMLPNIIVDEPQIISHNAPVRFRGPARIVLLSKYVPIDPFVGDTEIMQWSVGDVEVWIKNLDGGVSIYSNIFVTNHINGQDLLLLKESDLQFGMGIKSIGHRKLLMQAIQELKQLVIVEINDNRFLVPPQGIVLRFEDISLVQKYKTKPNETLLSHVTGTLVPNQLTAVIGNEYKSLLLKVLAGYDIKHTQVIRGHLYLNGSGVDGSLVTAGFASFLSNSQTYSNFTHTTVSDYVTFHAHLSGDHHHEIVGNEPLDVLIRHVLRMSGISYPQSTKMSSLKLVSFRRLKIAIDVVLYNIKLLFLDLILCSLTYSECQEFMQMIHSFSRKLDITIIISVERIRYALLITYFDQVIVIGDVNELKIKKKAKDNEKQMNVNVPQVKRQRSDSSILTSTLLANHDREMSLIYPQTVPDFNGDEGFSLRVFPGTDIKGNKNIPMVNDDDGCIPSSIRFNGRPEDILEYFRYKNVSFNIRDNPIDVICEEIECNSNLIIHNLEYDYFRYRKKPFVLSPWTVRKGSRNSFFRELFIIIRFVLLLGWREWSIFYSFIRIIIYCVIIGSLFWDVSCERYFINERLFALFVIACLTLATVWPMMHFYYLHRSFWSDIVFYQRMRSFTLVIALLMYACTHAVFVAAFSFIPWIMEDLGAGKPVAFFRVFFIQFIACLIYAMVSVFAAEILIVYKVRIASVMLTSSVLFAGAIVHPAKVVGHPAQIFITIDWMKYVMEFLLYTDVDYIQHRSSSCTTYISSLKDRQYYDQEYIDFAVLFAWLWVVLFCFYFIFNYNVRQLQAYCSQFHVNQFECDQQLSDFPDMPSLPSTPALSVVGNTFINAEKPLTINVPYKSRIPLLPLHITPLTANVSTASKSALEIPLPGKHDRITSISAFSHASLPSNCPNLEHQRGMSDQPVLDVAPTLSSLNSLSTPMAAPLPPERSLLIPTYVRQPLPTIKSNSSSLSTLQTQKNDLVSNDAAAAQQQQPTRIIQHRSNISLSGMETIREKAIEEHATVPQSLCTPSTTDNIITQMRTIPTMGASVTSSVKIFDVPDVRTSITAGKEQGMIYHSHNSSRYSALGAFPPLRHSQFGGRTAIQRRSSVNMKSQQVPRFLQMDDNNARVSTLFNANMNKHQSTLSKISFASATHELPSFVQHTISDTLQSLPALEEVSKQVEHIQLDDYQDSDLYRRLKNASLVFYDITAVDKYHNIQYFQITGHVIENSVTVLLSSFNIDTQPLMRAIAGLHTDKLLCMEGRIIINNRELKQEMHLAQNRIISYVPQNPVLPDLITVQEIIKLSFILSEPEIQAQTKHSSYNNVNSILSIFELNKIKDMYTSQISRLDFIKVSIAYCGLRSKSNIIFVENVFNEFNLSDKKCLLRCLNRMATCLNVSVLTCMHEMSYECVEQNYINHIILLAPMTDGATVIYEGSAHEALHILPKLFPFRKYENVVDEMVSLSKPNTPAIDNMMKLIKDLRTDNDREMKARKLKPMPICKSHQKKWLAYWWVAWIHWRFVSNHRRLFFVAVIKLSIHVLLVCMAFWRLPSTVSGTQSMFGAMNALLFIFIMQTPGNHRLFLPLLKLGIQDWQNGKYSLNLVSTLHCWAQYIFSICLACITSLLAYFTINFDDPPTSLAYSIVLFALGFIYSAGVWDSIYFVLFAFGYSQNVSLFVLTHLLVFFWLFSGCFILKTSMPIWLTYIGYYANPVRLTLESQFCAIILPKTFGNERGSDILAKSGYDCAIGFDLSLVFFITFCLRIFGSLVLAYKYRSIPLYNHLSQSAFDSDDDEEDGDRKYNLYDDESSDTSSSSSDSDDNDFGDDSQPMKDEYGQQPFVMNVNHVLNTEKKDNHRRNESIMDTLKKFMQKTFRGLPGSSPGIAHHNSEIRVGLVQNDRIHLPTVDDEDEDDSDCELVQLDIESHLHSYQNNKNNARVIPPHSYNQMIIGHVGPEDVDDVL